MRAQQKPAAPLLERLGRFKIVVPGNDALRAKSLLLFFRRRGRSCVGGFLGAARDNFAATVASATTAAAAATTMVAAAAMAMMTMTTTATAVAATVTSAAATAATATVATALAAVIASVVATRIATIVATTVAAAAIVTMAAPAAATAVAPATEAAKRAVRTPTRIGLRFHADHDDRHGRESQRQSNDITLHQEYLQKLGPNKSVNLMSDGARSSNGTYAVNLTLA
jgi:hypothetical protein